MEPSKCMKRTIGSVVCAVAVLFLGGPGTAAAGEGEVVISGTLPSKRKVAPPAEGRAFLYGPVQLTKPLKESTGIVYVVLEGVTFDPAVGSEAQLYLVDASGTAKELQIDPRNYVGSAASVAGGKTQGVQLLLELNDFKTDNAEFKARTHFRTMDQAFLALVVTRGKVQFRRALITTKSP